MHLIVLPVLVLPVQNAFLASLAPATSFNKAQESLQGHVEPLVNQALIKIQLFLSARNATPAVQPALVPSPAIV